MTAYHIIVDDSDITELMSFDEVLLALVEIKKTMTSVVATATKMLRTIVEVLRTMEIDGGNDVPGDVLE